jgi:chaperone BCS1
MEVLTITVLFGTPDPIRGWIAEGASLCREREKTGPGLHVLRGDWWAHVSDLRVRPLDTVLAEDGRIAKVAADMRRFLGAEDWYGQRGVPWRRGYLFHGPPGTGKSSLIRALASELGRDIATVPLSSRALSDEDLRDGMTNAPRGAMLVLEDIDASFVGRNAGESAGGVTFSGLLNAIDGVAAQEGRILVMTTNHPDKLDPALIRPGRADMHVELGLVGADVARRLFLRFFPEEQALADRFALSLGEQRVSPAALQGWLLEHAFDPQKAACAGGLRPAQNMMAAE